MGENIIHVTLVHYFAIISTQAGADPGFSFKGGVTGYVPVRTLRARNRTHFRQGSRARLRALEARELF